MYIYIYTYFVCNSISKMCSTERLYVNGCTVFSYPAGPKLETGLF